MSDFFIKAQVVCGVFPFGGQPVDNSSPTLPRWCGVYCSLMNKDRISKVRKVGNSLVITVPSDILRVCEIARGDEVIFGIDEKGQVVFRKLLSGEISL